MNIEAVIINLLSYLVERYLTWINKTSKKMGLSREHNILVPSNSREGQRMVRKSIMLEESSSLK